MHDIASPQQQQAALRVKQLYAAWRQNRDLIAVGAYQHGSDPRIDSAIAFHPRLREFLQQDIREPVTLADSLQQLDQLLVMEPAVVDGRNRETSQ